MVRHTPVTKSRAKRPAVKVAVAVMLAVAILGALWVPIYAHSLPKLGAFPFFYWYQLILVPVTAILCWICYLLLRTKPAAPAVPTAREREGARR
jgi:protein-S-isoprenylcysteine O-methyltransferase Ste14